MLTIRNLNKSFWRGRDKVTVLNNVSLEVKKEHVYGFLGPNGAGKTTTIKLIAGLLFPESGTVSINNLPTQSSEAKQLIGFMSEQPQFYQYLKTNEVLQFVGELFGLSKDVIAKQTDKLLRQVGLQGAEHQLVRSFSKGMTQRLAFAVAAINDPQLLILDEPLDGLDPLGRLDFKKLIEEWRGEGRTIFFSSHILSDVEELCDQVAIMNQGKIIAEGSPKKLMGKKYKSLEEYFVTSIRHQRVKSKQ